MKRIALLLGLLTFIVLALFLGVPLALSTDTIKTAISKRLSTLTGHSVRLRGDTDIKIFPFLMVRMTDVEIGSSGRGPTSSDVTMDKLHVSLRFIPLLTGDISVKRFTLVRPKFQIAQSEADAGFISTFRSDPLFGQWLKAFSAETDTRLEEFAIEDGTVQVLMGPATYDSLRPDRQIRQLFTTIKQSGLNDALNASGSFLWKEQPVTFDLGLADMQTFVEGSPTNVSASLNSDILSFSFDGATTWVGDLKLDGAVEMQAPSIRYVFNWLDIPLGQGAALGQFAINAKLAGLPSGFSLTDATMVIDGNTGDGALTFSLEDGGPVVSGTLAFDRFDAEPYLSTIAQASFPGQHWTTIGISVPDWPQLTTDIRFSAAQLTFRDTTFGELAAGLRIHDHNLSLDIASLDMFGGHASGTVIGDFSGQPSIEGQLKFTDIPAEKVSSSLLRASTITGQLTANVDIKTQGRYVGDLLKQLTGSLEMDIKQGNLSPFDLPILDKELNEGRIPKPDNFLTNETPFEQLTASLVFEKGIATIKPATLSTTNLALTFEGVCELITLALHGKGTILAPQPPKEEEAQETTPTESPIPRRFRINGRVDRPFITPDFRFLLQKKRSSWQ